MKIAAAFVSGIVAGILDICGAFIVYVLVLDVTTPGKILQSIAAGLYGKDTYNRGINSAIIGLGFHFIIACIFAFIYVFAFRNVMRRITENKLITGIIYGCCVWASMNYVVMPLSASAMHRNLQNLNTLLLRSDLSCFVSVSRSLISVK